MSRVTCSVLLSLALSACKSEPPPPPPAEKPAEVTPPAPPAPPAFSAAQTFDTVCASCHGATGHGDGMLAATLDPKPASFADPAFWATRDQAHVAKVIKEGGKSVGKSETMAAYGGTYNDEQIQQLAALVVERYKPKDAPATP